MCVPPISIPLDLPPMPMEKIPEETQISELSLPCLSPAKPLAKPKKLKLPPPPASITKANPPTGIALNINIPPPIASGGDGMGNIVSPKAKTGRILMSPKGVAIPPPINSDFNHKLNALISPRGGVALPCPVPGKGTLLSPRKEPHNTIPRPLSSYNAPPHAEPGHLAPARKKVYTSDPLGSLNAHAKAARGLFL